MVLLILGSALSALLVVPVVMDLVLVVLRNWTVGPGDGPGGPRGCSFVPHRNGSLISPQASKWKRMGGKNKLNGRNTSQNYLPTCPTTTHHT